MPDSTRYRVVDFIGGRILEAREMMTLQNMIAGVDTAGNVVVQGLNAIYREGATLNVVASIGAGNTNVTLSPIDNTKPMQVFLHGRWETLRSSDAPTVTMGASRTLYLNWAINVITSVQDPSLVDGTTGEATANMGELDFSIGATDTSGVALGSSQLAKNTSPIVLFNFATSGSSLTVVPLDNVLSPAHGTSSHAGPVKLTTDTADGVAVSTDDPRMNSARAPLTGSVVDASVRTPVPTAATNPDGSQQYDLTGDPGGISADKIIFQTARERLSDFLAFIQAQVASVVTTLTGHIGSGLGLSNTHPMPSASQVGAAPLSHVNLPLGAPGSHPAVVNSDSGGFQVNQTNSNSEGAGAFELVQNNARVAAIQHNGDIVSILLNPFVMNPGGGPIVFSGTLNSLSQLAAVVRDHVNQNNRANPHGLTAGDLGAVTSSAFARQCNGNGCFRIWPDGTIECWGSVSAAATGNMFSTAFINFPTGFSAPPTVMLTVVGIPSDAHPSDTAEAQIGNLTDSSANVALQCSVPEGGGGATFTNSVSVHFYAIGS